MGSQVGDLLLLLVDYVGSVAQVLVNQILVRLVDEGCEEYGGGSNHRKTPEWYYLDKVVGDESTKECLQKN